MHDLFPSHKHNKGALAGASVKSHSAREQESGEHEQGDKRAENKRKSGVNPEQSEVVIHIRCE